MLHLCQEARASRFPAPFPGLTPPTSLHLVFLVLKSMVQQILGIPLKPLSGNVGGARAIAESHGEATAFQEALLQAQKPILAARVWLAISLVCPPCTLHCKLISETQFICYDEAKQKLMPSPVHFLPPLSAQFCQTLSVKRDHLDLFFWALLLDMTFLGTHQLHGGVYVFIFYKVSFEKHSNAQQNYFSCFNLNFD